MTNSLWLVFFALFSINVHANNLLPVTGNPNGRVTLVEYYDYTCSHCRRMEPVIEKLQRHCPKLRIVYRPAPILTPISRPLAAFVLAVVLAKGHKGWFSLHQALLNSLSVPTLSSASFYARQLGLNPIWLWHESQGPAIQRQLQENIKLAVLHSFHGAIELPLLVLGQTDGRQQPIVLTGEQPYRLLYQIIQAMGRHHEE